MCGIAGIYHRSGRAVDESSLIRLRDSITHRGPDDAGIYRSDGIGLASRRLAVIDLSPRGHMPMPNADESAWIVFNGEIYNHQALRRELEAKGARFHSDCDTEVILHAYEFWGDACVERLHGMFAFALWDTRRRRLFATRDRLGVKPFFYLDDGDRFAFCSELAGLYDLSSPSFERIDPVSLDFYLGFGYLPPDRALLDGVNKLPPGHILVLDESGVRTSPYWKVEFNAVDRGDLEDDLAELDIILRRAVAKRLRSDVPLGCFLSGGIDSGLVTALAAEASDQPINTYSVGFAGMPDHADERPLARLVAERFGTRHHEIEVEPANHEILPEILRHVGEPFADVGILPMYQISKSAREHITVALSGDGGDESFAGYPNVTHALTAERVRARIPATVCRALESLTGLSSVRDLVPRAEQAHRFLHRYVNGGVVGQFDANNHWDESWRARLYTRETSARRGEARAARLIAAITERQPELRWADQNLFVDLQLRLGGGYLTKVDIASNMVSLEVRSPFLDHEIVEFAARLPLERKLLHGRQKGLLRKYARRILPAEITNAPKRGFAPGLDQWLRGPWSDLVREFPDRSLFVRHGFFEKSVVRTLCDSHLGGRESHGQRLWSLICLDRWGESFLA